MVWLIGISHEEKYLEQVLDRLAHEDLANKKVMVEMFAYPMPKAIKKRYPSHANFWDRLASYIQSRNGTLIFGDDKKLYYEAKQKTKEFMKNLPRKRITELARQYGNIAYVKRNPHFAKVIAKKKPDIVMLGYGHIPYLAEKFCKGNNDSVSYIPSNLESYL